MIRGSSTGDTQWYSVMGKLHLRQSQPTFVKAEKALPVPGPARVELGTEISGHSDNQLMDLQIGPGKF